MTDRELLQQALDALISVWNSDRTTRQVETIRAIKARLAQHEPEPVAWGVPNTRPTEKAQFMMLLHSPDGCQYPEQLVPLYIGQNDFNPDWDAMAVMVEEQQRMAKRIEELEARLAQPEPVTDWPLAPKTGYYNIDGKRVWLEAEEPFPETAPPKKEWVGLTDEDKRKVCEMTERDDRGYVMAIVEEKLKEKNT